MAQEPASRYSPIVLAVQKAAPSVVNISGKKTTTITSLPGQRETSQVNGMGTGLIIDSSGYILTNYHVIAGINNIQVKLNPLASHPKTTHSAKLIGFNEQIDLAVIKISSDTNFQVMTLATSSDLMLGETVIAIGNAYGYEDTITRGIISALHRRVEINTDQFYDNLIQTDASINPGNSGGPLINIQGDAIAVNVAVRVGAQSIGFAIPMDRAMVVAKEILMSRSRQRLDVGLNLAVSFRERSPRIVVTEVDRNSLANDAGLKTDDVITHVNGAALGWPAFVYQRLLESQQTDEIELTIERTGTTRVLHISMQNLLPKDDILAARVWQEIGIRVVPVKFKASSKQASYRGGLKITEVKATSPATNEGLKSGDILLGLHKWETVTFENLSYVLNTEMFQTRKPMSFYIYRDADFLYGELFQQ
ncbi:MAG: PDZ domain-containing protein [Planctomycetaceae bacterium]|nr:PDZ domain-containing protein [Planctomycetaceae bacterium]